MTDRHKVFVSYHHDNDQGYRDEFERILSNYDISVLKSVQMGDIDEDIDDERIRQIIRDDYLRDSTVTVVLIGSETWKRKHVDWEIGSSLRSTKLSSRSGLLGILLPSHSDYNKDEISACKIPPRLYDNHKCGFVKVHMWEDDPNSIKRWIHEAFNKRNQIDPDNTRPSFKRNHSGDNWC